MQIIKWIKIRNFRSFTWIKSEVVDLKDFNIFSWANDSWKSNIFRALNLFFNNEISHWIPFLMDRDFSEQKSNSKHRVIEIRLDFELTTDWSKYLSKEFAIEKKYYRWDNYSYDYTFIYKNKDWSELSISSNPDNNEWIDDEKQYRKQFNEFLWKINFEYIPAIRETRYFSYLFWRVISKLRQAEQERVSKIDDFIKELNDPKWSIRKKINLIKVREDKIKWIKKKKWIEEYGDDYKEKLRKEVEILKNEINDLEDDNYINSKLKEQKEYRVKISEFDRAIVNLSNKINTLSGDLFRNISFIENAEFTIADNLLDFFETFEIWTWDSKKISLKSRWDWMQSRFIPVILDFLSKIQKENKKWVFDWEYERNKYFIWWFEEPENSYEYSNSIRLANNFIWIKNKIKDENWDYLKNINWELIYEEVNYSERKQIFITTHSEEFLRLFSEENLDSQISLYLVEKQKKDKSSVIRFINEKDLKDVHNNLWLANIARSKLKFDIWQKIIENDFLKNQIEELLKTVNQIEESKKNILYVEDTYIDLYKIAYLKINEIQFNQENFNSIFNKNSNFDIFWAEWASNLWWFLNAKNIDIFKDKKIIWLFDFDEEWKNQFKYTLKKWNNWPKEKDYYWDEKTWIYKKRDKHLCFYALLIPLPERLLSLANFEWWSYIEIEHLFKDEFLINNDFWKKITITWNTPFIKIDDNKKKKIWIKSIDLNSEDFEDFQQLFFKINELFNLN